MLFANGYRYHMRNVGCPMSLDGYGLTGSYFGRYRNSLGSINNYNNYLNASSRREIYSNPNRNRIRRIQSRNEGSSNFSNLNDVNSCFNVIRSIFGLRNESNLSMRPRMVPLISKKCVISMSSALIILLLLGLISTIVGGIYFQKGNHPYSFKDNIHQLLCIIAIICGIIMLLSSGVLFRVLFCKSKWNNSSVTRQPVYITSNNPSNVNESSNCDETVLNLNNDEDLFSSNQYPTHFFDSFRIDEPPTYSECNASVADSDLINSDFLASGQLLDNTEESYVRSNSLSQPPKYSNDPPPRYSQLDVRSLMITVVTSHSSQDNCSNSPNNGLESPSPAIEGISSPNNSSNEIETDNILFVENYKPC